jgi:predicted TIM-barrel fold metal-dependent hydrolase
VYVQCIESHEYAQIVEICRQAEELGLGIALYTTYGSTKLFRYNPMALAAEICEEVKQAPILFLHSGGAQVLKALLLADMCSNVYLETSLSLCYYKNFRLMEDFKDTYRHLGASRILFASDFPFEPVQEAISQQQELFESIGFSAADIEAVFLHNARKLVKHAQ